MVFFHVINDINFASPANDNTIYCLGKNTDGVNLSVGTMKKLCLRGGGIAKKKAKINRERGVMIKWTLFFQFEKER